MRGVLIAIMALLLTLTGGAAEARVKKQADFAFPPGQPVKIVVFRPDVQVGSMALGGVETPNADWTASARTKLRASLETLERQNGNQVSFVGDLDGADGKLVDDYQALFRAVAAAVAEHKFGAARLPTKRGKFDWTLGPGAAALGRVTGGNYALLLYTHDAYGTAGRKVMQVLVAGLFGGLMPAGIHVGYAALVDLSTGDLVWFNIDPETGGDPRTDDGATKRIGELMRSFPTVAATAR